MMHSVINIAHLEPYESSPTEFGERPTRHLNRESFEEAPEYEVEKIVDEKLAKQGLKRVRKYKIQWKGYGPEFDEWLTAYRLRNAPEVLAEWKLRKIDSN
ncbi:hypothetical protein BN14_12417 [Rhizoctonia solani AG-1 IB]|uniref:Chromo domain-containing protein n=1 Tax=Thanatephorus cucumeris (strain AG1-IB / isolate 7/3/14) TaxID=1108050 RepID=M5CFQ4_THACB|nr:hypothetical protein BN14_12417 [Rhizoctonia solani AG-1 IB]